MPVVCATNLSDSSSRAAQAAAALAARLREPLWLLGVLEGEAPAVGVAPAEARRRLLEEAARLSSPGLTVEARLLEGPPGSVPGDELVQGARLLVISAEGWGPVSPWRRAPVPERLAQQARVPVWVVRRQGEALLDWAQGRRRLQVLVGVDESKTSACAVAWLRELRQVGPCDVLATTVCSPVEERERLGIHTPVHLEMLDPVVRRIEVLDPQVEQVLLRELAERVGELPGEGRVELHLEPGFGRPSDHLLHVAHERGVDLVVVGNHQRGGLARLWHGSVSAGVLRYAEQSVACVPPTPSLAARSVPPRAVLVPIDFSEASARAIAEARALVRPGGRVHLLHVRRRRAGDRTWMMNQYGVVPEPPGEQSVVMERLKALVPREDGARTVRWTMEGVTGDDVARAICQATEREGVDLVCLGTSDAPGPAGYLSESVARALVERCRRPVVVLHA